VSAVERVSAAWNGAASLGLWRQQWLPGVIFFCWQAMMKLDHHKPLVIRHTTLSV
jgi:hypothetical protein